MKSSLSRRREEEPTFTDRLKLALFSYKAFNVLRISLGVLGAIAAKTGYDRRAKLLPYIQLAIRIVKGNPYVLPAKQPPRGDMCQRLPPRTCARVCVYTNPLPRTRLPLSPSCASRLSPAAPDLPAYKHCSFYNTPALRLCLSLTSRPTPIWLAPNLTRRTRLTPLTPLHSTHSTHSLTALLTPSAPPTHPLARLDPP